MILDFFGGSGTTLHATLLLNSHTEGHRQCILVTNNELEEALEKQLRKKADDLKSEVEKFLARVRAA